MRLPQEKACLSGRGIGPVHFLQPQDPQLDKLRVLPKQKAPFPQRKGSGRGCPFSGKRRPGCKAWQAGIFTPTPSAAGSLQQVCANCTAEHGSPDLPVAALVQWCCLDGLPGPSHPSWTAPTPSLRHDSGVTLNTPCPAFFASSPWLGRPLSSLHPGSRTLFRSALPPTRCSGRTPGCPTHCVRVRGAQPPSHGPCTHRLGLHDLLF